MTSSRVQTRRRSAEGTDVHRGVLVFAELLPFIGMAFPVVGSRGHYLEALPYALVGAAIGLALGVIGLRLLRASLGMPVMIVALFSDMFVVRQLDGAWLLAIAPYLLSTFAGAILGANWRSRARREKAVR